ncbi:MAG: ImmA/IrrE family metallo-endopeptidase [Methylacidiphilales bacterium]|nr:ImmA/IrrE family metallo-endopeptidase [Candidatus Methylacidiphilales bacterium]
MGINNNPVPKEYKLHDLVTDIPKIEPSTLTNEEIMRLAEQKAERLGYKPGEDLTELVKNINGRIEYCNYDFDYENKISGAISIATDKSFVVYIPKGTSFKRDRFTIAHELGHYYLHANEGAIPSVFKREIASDKMEYQANYFAGAFLMPSESFRDENSRLHGDDNKNIKLSIHFNVSDAAIAVRLKTLNLN